MTETISVPRELLLELRDSANDCYNNEVRRYKDDRRRIIYKALVDKADAILAQPAQAIIDQQAARIAELQKDADRYRWLEANSTYGIDYRQRPELTLPIYAPDHREGLDAAIDAAMGEPT